MDKLGRRMTEANEEAVRGAFRAQAEASDARGSPFTARLVEALEGILDGRTEIGRRVLDWRGRPDARGDSVPLRLAGGLHALVRRGRLPRLSELYPPHPLPAEDALASALGDALRDADGELLPWLDRPPQTNEPLRSAPLMAGLLVVAARTKGKPLALFEAGASAGLILVLDRYRHRLGGTEAGDRKSPVVVAPAWEGPSPPPGEPTIRSRRGSDLDPLDVAKEEDRERLLAYVWPDQAERLARVEAAIALAAADPPRIDRADAAEWAERVIDPEPEPGLVRVLMHAVALQYAPEETRARIAAHAARVGERATDAAPFAWLRFESDPDEEEGRLRLNLWPGGEEAELAAGDTHAERLRWTA
jgi:hypothetical protein